MTRFCIARPLDVLLPSGISYTRIQKHFPFWVKNSIYWWFVPTKRCSKKSSLRVVEAFCPTPPLFCVRYSVNDVRLMYPAWDMVITTCSFGIMSSIDKSPPAYSMVERRSSPYFSLTTANSSLIICIRRSFLSKISFKSSMVFIRSSYSVRNLSCSNPVSWRKRISTMALAWISLNSKRLMSFWRASSGLEEPRMIDITSSILSEAIISPSKMWARSSAFRSSYFVRRTTTSWRCSTKWWIISFRFNISGRPLTKAMLFTLKEDWSAVYLNSLFNTMFGIASRFNT